MTSLAESTVLPAHLSPDASRALGGALGDSAPVAELRARAAAAAGRLSLPTRADRPWKYLDLSGFDLGAYHPAPAAASSPSEIDGTTLEVIDGSVRGVLRVSGATFGGLGSPELAELANAHLGGAVAPESGLFAALHYAFLDGVVVTHVPADVELVSEPIRISRTFSGADRLNAPHTLIVTDANARVSIVEDLRASDDPRLVLPVVEVLPGPGSEVRYTVLHRWGRETRVFSDQRVVTAPDSAVRTLSVALGGAVVKSHVLATLSGRGSSSDIYGLFQGSAEQQFDLFTIQDHVAPDTRSDLLYKSALHDAARSVYYGLTRVGLEARNADANQENRNLLLSKTARADSDPVLEIFTNNVIRAAHGATAGPVDESQLFYLEARGLPRPHAEELLVGAFLGEVLDRVPDAALRTEIAESLGIDTEEVL